MLTKVELRKVSAQEAIDYLQREAKRLDPRGIGIPITIDVDLRDGPVTIPGVPGEPPFVVEPLKVTVYLETVRFQEALHSVTSLANLGFNIRADGIHITSICTIETAANTMETREFPIPTRFVLPANKTPGDTDEFRHSPERLFSQWNIDFPSGTGAKIDESGTRWIVRHNLATLPLIETIITPPTPIEAIPIPGPEISKVTEGGRPLGDPLTRRSATLEPNPKSDTTQTITREYLIPPKINKPLELPNVSGRMPSTTGVEETSSTESKFEPDFPRIPDEDTPPGSSPKITYLEDERKLIVHHTAAAHEFIRRQVEAHWKAYYRFEASRKRVRDVKPSGAHTKSAGGKSLPTP